MKRCYYCKTELNKINTYKSKHNSGGIRTACKECEKKELKNFFRELRKDIINAYGHKCVCCGETRFEFLAIDHKNGGGSKERNTTSPTSVYLRIKREGYPKEFRLLCHNCNQSIGSYKYCPHEKERTNG